MQLLSKRFNSLVPQSESLLLRLDHVVTTESRPDSPVSNFLKSLCKPFHDPLPVRPDQELGRGASGGGVNLEKGAAVKWKAEFGKTLKTCVVVAFRSASTVSSSSDGESDAEFVTGLKTRVEWTINALMAASTRHHLMSQVVKEHKEIESLVINERGGEGTVVMKSEGLKELRKTEAARDRIVEERVEKNRGVWSRA
ncbi:hypothetical protein Bca52824_034238 [Brassica carinata]|uniref:Uncharacterized protein n=1 Tax=Brassica carinata TaxID=52824 RepID=A0A8X7V1L1_BRACI|nr:hypothetical protein Bca52824_034238 [Brassica carinata]